ncbi:MAG: hypothetical protein ACFE9R_12735 [Candidatus Hermodarchaeota archaeon]
MLREEYVKKVQIVCPICKVKEIITLPSRIIRNTTHLTTVSIPKGKVCKHHFQIFVDKAFNIRGYQKVDFELPASKKTTQKNKRIFTNGFNLYRSHNEHESNLNCSMNERGGKLRKIYEAFWEVIDDENEEFKKFIHKDKRRMNKLQVIEEGKDDSTKFIEIISNS